MQRASYAEAVRHETAALELLKGLPDTPARRQQELTLQLALGVLLRTVTALPPPKWKEPTPGHGSCAGRGRRRSNSFSALQGLWQFNILRAELQTARELGEQLLSLAQRVQAPELFPEAHRAVGEALLWLGDLPTARAHLEQGIACYEPLQDRSHLFLYGLDSGVTCRVFAAQALWLLGYPDQALQRMHEALTLAQELAHPLSMVFALIFAPWSAIPRQEVQLTQERAEAAIALCTEHGFGEFWLAQANVWRGLGTGRAGTARGRASPDAPWHGRFSCRGGRDRATVLACLTGRGVCENGAARAGASRARGGRAIVDKTGERFWEAELHRLEGELTLQSESQESRVSHSRGRGMFPQGY